MRGHVAMTMICLASGCIYLEDLNYPPEVTLAPTREGPYYRGAAIQLTATGQDRNGAHQDELDYAWELTDDHGHPLAVTDYAGCTPAAAGCFVPLKLDVVYRMSVTATDPRGAFATAHRDFSLQNQPPTAKLEVESPTNQNGNYALFGQVRFSAAGSDDPDAADDCVLSYTFDLVRPMTSTDKYQFVACGQNTPKPGCGGDGPIHCLTPDAPGAYTVTVTVTDPSGASSTDEVTVQVDPDAPPCLTQFAPRPIERIFVSRSEGTRTFSVNVSDDLDPWPPASTNEAGAPAFTWSLQSAGDPAPVAIPDYESNHYELDLLAFSAGEVVHVRVDARDRVDRSATLPCDPAAPICPAGVDPLSEEACVQRLTWTLEVY